jgi:hypothetical protein
MHSSISSSEAVLAHPPVEKEGGWTSRTGFIVLVVGLALILLAFELGSPIILDHLSRTEHRVEVELKAAQALQPKTADGRPTVLLAGNSLLLEGVQMEKLHDELAPKYEVSRLGIEQTHFLDWYFGLRRLLQEGARPTAIVLALGTDQLASKFTLGEEFAHRQMSARDLPLAIQETNLDRTTASTYFFAHWSNWLADKGVIRQRVLIVLVPNFRALAGRIADHGAHIHEQEVLVGMAKKRLPQLAELSRTYGVRIVLMVPPALREDYSRVIQQVGADVGIPVWVLSPPGEYPRNLYSDGYHLNQRGSADYTSRLAEQIREQSW